MCTILTRYILKMFFRRKRSVFILILLAALVFYRTLFSDVVFKFTSKEVQFWAFTEDQTQGSKGLSAVRMNAHASGNGLKYDHKERFGDDLRFKTAETRTKVELMYPKKDNNTKESHRENTLKGTSLDSFTKLISDKGKISTDTHVSWNQNPEKYNKSTSKGVLSTPVEDLEINTSKTTIANIEIRRGLYGNLSYCDLPFKYGKMCPQSYTELGGLCGITTRSRSVYCPDIRFKADNPHRQGQLITTRLLRIFDLICRKHNISYWLSGGTLLGAARHKGNIPWDTDNDVDIPLQDYIQFFQTASKDLPDDIFFQNSLSDPALKPSNPAEATSLAHKVVGIYKRSWNPRLRDKKSCYKYCIENGCSWHDGMMIDIFVHEKTPDVFPLKQMEFEGFRFPVPNNWRSKLESTYGHNFMEVPVNEQDRKPVDFPDIEHRCDELKTRQSLLLPFLIISIVVLLMLYTALNILFADTYIGETGRRLGGRIRDLTQPVPSHDI